MATSKKPAEKVVNSDTWFVATGLDYYSAVDGEWHRAEPGDKITGLVENDVLWLIDQGAISDTDPNAVVEAPVPVVEVPPVVVEETIEPEVSNEDDSNDTSNEGSE